MRLRRLLCVPAICSAVAFLAACAMPQGGFETLPAQWNAYGPPAHGTALIYAGNQSYVETYSFPGGAAHGTFTVDGLVEGMCSNSKGDVFVALAPRKRMKSPIGFVEEYAHGGTTPIATLQLPNREIPVACSSDPATGNLAVTAQNSVNYAPAVAIYANASGTPKVYTSRALGAYPQAAYDAAGDLFATSGANVGVELAAGKDSLKKITLTQTLGGAQHVQWDGKYWAIESFDTSKHNREKLFERIFRVQISGSRAKVVGTSRFDAWPASDPGQAWIANQTILATPRSSILFWAYPSGGAPRKTVHSPHHVKAITVSSTG